jgi:purine-binding chemotaxis protein CheW
VSEPAAPRELVTFVLDEQRWALPVGAVERVLPMVAVAPLPNGPAIALGVINVHGRVVPALDLRRRLGLPPREYGLGAHLLLAHTPRRPVAMPVDEVLGVLRVAPDVVTPPEAVLPGIGQVAGIVALPDGLLLIQDLEQVLALEEEERLDAALDGMEP